MFREEREDKLGAKGRKSKKIKGVDLEEIEMRRII